MRLITTGPSPGPQPPGFLHVPDLISTVEERAILDWFAQSTAWNEVTFRGQTARRRAMSFGARYLTQGRRLTPAPPLPPDLVVYRDRMVDAACAGLGLTLALAGRTPPEFALCTALHYPPGAAIGWHIDSPAFGPTVLSLSLGAPSLLELRRADSVASSSGAAVGVGVPAPAFQVILAPRSLFVLSGEARSSWQHRLRPVRAERYSLTVRAAKVSEVDRKTNRPETGAAGPVREPGAAS